MTCKQGLSANWCERARTLRTLAMQKVVGSNPIIRSENTCKTAGSVVCNGNSPSLMVTLRCGLLPQSTTQASRLIPLIATMNPCAFS
jgi:hypothetical protein